MRHVPSLIGHLNNTIARAAVGPGGGHDGGRRAVCRGALRTHTAPRSANKISTPAQLMIIAPFICNVPCGGAHEQ
jgi:hypothetical protein